MKTKKNPSTHSLVRRWQRHLHEGVLFEAPGDEDEEEGEEGAEEEEVEEPEPDPDPEPEPEQIPGTSAGDSLDNQVDSYLIGFEDESTETQNEWVSMPKKSHFRSLSEKRRRKGRTLWEAFDNLMEAPDDEEDEETTDNAEPENPGPAAPPPPPLNLDTFAQRVARLVNNYDTMLDIPGSIVDRARRFLQDNYDEDTAAQFEEILATQHDIEPDQEGSEYPEYGPPAYGAEGVPSAGGGLGGGGDIGGDI